MSGKKTHLNRIVHLVVICLVIAGAAAAAGHVRSKYVLPIAMYHSVMPGASDQNRLVVSPRTFERQMAFLKRHGYSVLRLEEAVELMVDPRRSRPRKPVVLTFDDGNQDNYTYAFPVLKKYGFAATIFIPVDFIGQPGRLTWEQIREMQDSGLVSFGSHSLSHCFLETLTDQEQLAAEIAGSRKTIEEKLGVPVLTFSYPCGRLNDRVREMVAGAGYRAAVVTNPGKKIPDNDRFALKRLRISENAANMFIFWVETSGYYNLLRENRHK